MEATNLKEAISIACYSAISNMNISSILLSSAVMISETSKTWNLVYPTDLKQNQLFCQLNNFIT
jgi:hypothetical protein